MFNLDEIKDSFKRIIKYNFLYNDNGQFDIMIDTWLANKKKFIEAFGGELTYSIDLKNICDINMMFADYNIVDDFVEQVKDFLFKSIILTPENHEQLNSFLKFINDLSLEQFFSNHLVLDNKTIRISKYFKKLLSTFDDGLVTTIQNYYSERVQVVKNHGKLVFSVHPLDFLSASENQSNWRSCHALDGDYGLGNIQFMLDDVTFMVYIISNNKKYVLPNFPKAIPWNNKKWRTYFFLKDNVLFRGKSYPYENQKLIECITLELEKLNLITNVGQKWETFERNDPFLDKITNENLHKKFYFNDLLFHSTYKPRVYINLHEQKLPHINIGKDFLCFYCGKKIATQDKGVCYRCEDIIDF